MRKYEFPKGNDKGTDQPAQMHSLISTFVVLWVASVIPLIFISRVLGLVVQSIVSLTTSLRRQLVKYMPTKLSNTVIFCWKNVRIFCTAKDPHIFQQKITVYL